MLKLGKVADELRFVATKDGKQESGVYGHCLKWLCDGEPPEALVEITGGPRPVEKFEVQHLRKAIEPARVVTA
jgi:hypothetical protein